MFLVLASCGGSTETVPDIPPGSQSIPFTTLNGLFGGDRIQNSWSGGSSRQVVHNQAEWNQLYQTVTGDSPAPASFPPSKSGVNSEWNTVELQLMVIFYSPRGWAIQPPRAIAGPSPLVMT